MSPDSLTEETKALVEAHLPMVPQVLAGVGAHFPRHADRDELAQAARLGLVEAAVRYDGARGVPFERWAALRMRGAILDTVRALDFAPRALRAASRDVESARVELTAALGRTPTSQDIADRLGVPVSQVDQLEGRLHGALVLSLDAPLGEEQGAPVTLASALVSRVEHQPSEVLERRERATYVRDALHCLPERLRAVVISYFFEGMTSAEIAERLGVTESRVSQLRTDALQLMRAGIEAQYAEGPVDGSGGPGRHRRAEYAVELAARSSYASRLSQLPRQRTTPEARGVERLVS